MMRSHRRISRLVLVLTVAISAGACGVSESTSADVTEPGADDVGSGEVLYQANCASCHGVDLRGTDKGPSHLSNVYEPNHHGDASFLLAVRNGSPQHHWRFGDMEPIEGLTDDDIVAITAFVREQQAVYGFEPYPP